MSTASSYCDSGWASTQRAQPSKPRSPGTLAGALGGAGISFTVAPAALKPLKAATIASRVAAMPKPAGKALA